MHSYNKEALIKGSILGVISLFAYFFAEVLADPLKLYHGLWHLSLIGSLFYFFQVKKASTI